MFDKILIANRGEIACRIIRTARSMGVTMVAVYSDADAAALHVALADEACAIGAAPAIESYLRGDVLIETALRCGARAIHPGYGFLAENADFAEACAAAGITFVGPPAEVIRAMGDKAAARALMAEAGIPVLAGDSGEDDTALATAAARIGYPLMLKPIAGGGGKGMRLVASPADFAEALAAARREATAAFGDGRMLLERYVEPARHIEVQIFADARGNIVHLFDRECSLQRRHQKVVEEAPAPGLDPDFRRRLAETAVRAARAADYVGAGTVEFLVDGEGDFYFLEMNTRLQVEHPVTEMITGRDLVEWQLRIAAGESLPCEQSDLTLSGHAIEARLYAEDPARGFLPAAGRIVHLRLPEESSDLRIDTGVRAGDSITPHYDPLIAKVVVRGEDRGEALDRLRAALARLRIVGPVTNLAFLSALVADSQVAKGEIDTGFIERRHEALTPPRRPASARCLAFACLDAMMDSAETAVAGSRDPHSPWFSARAWRLNAESRCCLRFVDGDVEHAVIVRFDGRGYRLELPDGTTKGVRGRRDADGDLVAEIDGETCRATVVTQGRRVTVLADAEVCDLVRHDPLDTVEDDVASGRLTAPMPGKVVAVMVRAGDEVVRGAPLMVLEAMKMEHTIVAPVGSRVEHVNYAPGDLVDEGVELLALATTGET